MNRKYITIDGGTTNTRISYVDNFSILETVKLSCGSNPEGKEKLQKLCADTISDLSKKYGNPLCIIGCGMLTSEYGLSEVKHICAPAGISDFHDNMKLINLPDITDIPIYLIPGLKMKGESFLDVNIMRGEETEIIGLVGSLREDSIYILPGSHSKIINADKDGKICSVRSFMSGEMISSLSNHTILKGSVNLDSLINEKYLKSGYEFTKEHGINESLLKVRTMDIMFGARSDETYSFFIGCILEGEVNEIIKTEEKHVFIGGQTKLKEALKILLDEYSEKEIYAYPDEDCTNASIKGMIKIFEYKG